ncbi:MAG TPA: ACP S-malonyltransferase [Spirochaetia bacterium]
MKTCFLFPGQGAQYPGMAKDLWEASAGVKELFSKASKAAGTDMRALLFDASAEDLKATDKTQIAITLASLCSSTALRERGVTSAGCAGFSLGEYAALAEAGVIRFADLFPIVRIRGELMEKAARALDATDGAPGMAAVLGLAAEDVAAAVETLAGAGVHVANYNSPTQVVVSGTAKGLSRAEETLKARGARRFVRLQVSGPFHSPLMEAARVEFQRALAPFSFSDPILPVYSNVTGKRIASGAEARELCVTQLVSPVRWVTEEQTLLADGFDRFLETGPGTVLTGLLRSLTPQAACAPAGTLEGIAKVLEAA